MQILKKIKNKKEKTVTNLSPKIKGRYVTMRKRINEKWDDITVIIAKIRSCNVQKVKI